MQTASPNRPSDTFLLILVLVVLSAICIMLLPYFGALLSAMVVGVALYPVHERISRQLHRRSPNLQAFLSVLLVILLIILPAMFVIWTTANQAKELEPLVARWQMALGNLRAGNTESFGVLERGRNWLTDTVGIQADVVRRQLITIASTCAQFVSMKVADLAKGSLIFFLNLFVMLLTLFFIFRNGPDMVEAAQAHIPLRPEMKARVTRTLHHTVIGIVGGWFLTALAQGLMATIAYLIVGVPAVALLGFLTCLSGLIPAIGTALVWLPMAIFYMLQHSYGKGIFILIWGTLVVGVLDNFLRPYLLGKKIELPFLALFFALFGGIALWGFKGIFLGPMFMALAPVLLDEYRTHAGARTKTPDK